LRTCARRSRRAAIRLAAKQTNAATATRRQSCSVARLLKMRNIGKILSAGPCQWPADGAHSDATRPVLNRHLAQGSLDLGAQIAGCPRDRFGSGEHGLGRLARLGGGADD